MAPWNAQVQASDCAQANMRRITAAVLILAVGVLLACRVPTAAAAASRQLMQVRVC